MENTIRKVYTDAYGLWLFVCPNCGEVQIGQAQVYEDKWPVKINCKCGDVYDVIVEKRKFYRKETRLEGMYLTASNPYNWEKMIVKNISTHGCGFETLNPTLLDANEKIRILFKLDDDKNSLIRKRALVLIVFKKYYVSCKFIEEPSVFNPELEFYISNV